MNKLSIDHLFQLNTFQYLIHFLLGENFDNRRWNSNQAKEFGLIHEILSILILHSYSSNENEQIKTFFSNEQWVNRYLKEICYVFQEISSGQLIHTIELIEKLIKNNENLSEQFIRIILQTHMNDLKSLFKLLNHILLIEDSLQKKRLHLVFEGKEINNDCQIFNGLYSLIRTNIENEQRRTYQIVKFIITLSNKLVKNHHKHISKGKQ